LIEEAFK